MSSFSGSPLYFLYQDYDFLNKETIKVLDLLEYKNNFNLNELDQSFCCTKAYRSPTSLLLVPSCTDFEVSNGAKKARQPINTFLRASKEICSSFSEKTHNKNLKPLEQGYYLSNNRLLLVTKSSYPLFKSSQSSIDKSIKLDNSLNFNCVPSVLFLNSYKVSLNPFELFKIEGNSSVNNSLSSFTKAAQAINLRQSASEMISDYKSLQKVYKLRFDDLRSHVDVSRISSSFSKQLDLNSRQVKFDSVLNKSSVAYFKPIFFKLIRLESVFYDKNLLLNLVNNYAYDFPFLVSLQSDQSRYI